MNNKLTHEDRSASGWKGPELTPEKLSAAGKKGGAARWAGLTAGERSSIMKAMRAKPTAEARSASGKKGAATRLAGFTSEQLSAIAKARMAKIPPEQRSATRKKVWAGFSKEKRTAIGKKRTAKLTHEDHVAHGKKGFERMIAKVIESRAPAPKLSPKRQAAAAFYADWVKAGRPSGNDDIVEIARRHYPEDFPKVDRYPNVRAKAVRRYKRRFDLEEAKTAGHKSQKTAGATKAK